MAGLAQCVLDCRSGDADERRYGVNRQWKRRNSDPHRHHQRRLRGDRRRALPMRTPGESYSDVILRLVEVDANSHRLFVRVQSDVRRGFLCNPRLIVRRFLVEA